MDFLGTTTFESKSLVLFENCKRKFWGIYITLGSFYFYFFLDATLLGILLKDGNCYETTYGNIINMKFGKTLWKPTFDYLFWEQLDGNFIGNMMEEH